eukprot:3320234-Rhodomonas_salina.2
MHLHFSLCCDLSCGETSHTLCWHCPQSLSAVRRAERKRRRGSEKSEERSEQQRVLTLCADSLSKALRNGVILTQNEAVEPYLGTFRLFPSSFSPMLVPPCRI